MTNRQTIIRAASRKPKLESVRSERPSWMTIAVNDFTFNGAHIAVVILFVFYLTLDVLFSLACLVYAIPVAWIATIIGEQPVAVSGTVAAVAFFGGYAAQFVGHVVEKSVPVRLQFSKSAPTSQMNK